MQTFMASIRAPLSFAYLSKPLSIAAAADCYLETSSRGQRGASVHKAFLGYWGAFFFRRHGGGPWLVPRAAGSRLTLGTRVPGRLPRSRRLSATLPPEAKTSLRTHPCGILRAEHVGYHVAICGWAHTIRDRGGVTFLLLRDRYGIVQVTVDATSSEALRTQVKMVRRESVVRVRGTIRARDASNVNTAMATGSVEVAAESIEILSKAEPLPLALEIEHPETGIGSKANALTAPATQVGSSEETRLRYRFLDLRRPPLQSALIRRHQVSMAVRRVLDELGFIEIETPILTRATPEGARDYLVPSRVHRGKWYALPQSPQLYKQLLMVGGMDRYFQIARCFRDEDLRQDRQPEFTQVDLEMSFVRAVDVMQVVERVAEALFSEVLTESSNAGSGIADSNPKYSDLRFPILSYEESMERFGTDAPDLRFGLELQRVWSERAAADPDTEATLYKALSVLAPLDNVESIRALVVPDAAASTSRKTIDNYIQFVKNLGLSGLLWGKVGATDGQPALSNGPLGRLEPSAARLLLERLGARPGGLVLVAAGPTPIVLGALGRLRVKIARELGLVRDSEYRFCWVIDFPLFAWDEEADRLTCVHHPFTAPREDHRALLISLVQQMQEHSGPLTKNCAIVQELVRLQSDAYDLVCNGTEVGGGSIRIHDHELQRSVMRALSLTEADQEAKFGFLLQALRYGAPPHGGFAFGLDRCVMMASAQAQSLRDVIAFPKTTSASELMTAAPSAVEEEQLADLGISVTATKARQQGQSYEPAIAQDSIHPSRV